MNLFSDNFEIEAVVRGFESCQTQKEEFSHRCHLAVAVWYLCNMDPDAARKLIRQNLMRFLQFHGMGAGKFNETLTAFWLDAVNRAIERSDKESVLDITNSVIADLGNADLVFEYYTPELLWSERARRVWLPPDLKPF